MKRDTFKTGSGPHFGREVSGANNFSAWCGGPHGLADAKRVLRALESHAALKAEVKRLRREAYDVVDRKLACLVFAGVLDAKKCEPLLLALRAALKPVRKAKR